MLQDKLKKKKYYVFNDLEMFYCDTCIESDGWMKCDT